MMNEDKVSIIVPAYNVEEYISECIDSIIKQTYRNIEIIVIDDCSTDNTLNVLELYQEYPNIIIKHNVTNQGVSRTRNIALDYATGKYVVFVDGDDALFPDYIDYMLGLIKTTQGDMCLSINCCHDRDEKQIENDNIIKLLPAKATALLLSQEVDVGCWNKIYNLEFLNTHKIRFSEDLFYGEGLEFITNASSKAKVIGVGKRKVYFYRRNNAESATTKFDIKKYKNGWESLIRIKSNISDIVDEELEKRWLEHMNLFAMNSMVGIIQNKTKNVYLYEYQFWKKYLIKNMIKFLFCKYIHIKYKIKMIVILLIPNVYACYSFRKRNKLLRKV